MQTHLSLSLSVMHIYHRISIYIYMWFYIIRYICIYLWWFMDLFLQFLMFSTSHGFASQCCFGFPSKSCKASGQADASPKVCIPRLRSTGPSSMGRTVPPERAPDCTSWDSLVNIQKTDGKIMENHHFYGVNPIISTGPFSIANCGCLPKGMIFLWLNSLVYGRYNMV